jgi:hypothetical protein
MTETPKNFVLVKCAGREAEFPDHVQYRATCPPLDVFFWIRQEDGVIGAREFVRKRYPAATFSDETKEKVN